MTAAGGPAARVSSAASVERRLFEVLGAWAPEAPEPDAKLLFRVHSFAHARHAESAGESVRGDAAGGSEVAAAAARLEDVASGPADTVSRLIGVYRGVLPVLISAYDEPEHETARQEGERLLAKLSGGIAPAKSSGMQ